MIVFLGKPILDILHVPGPSLGYQGGEPQPGDDMMNNPHGQSFADILSLLLTTRRYLGQLAVTIIGKDFHTYSVCTNASAPGEQHDSVL